MSTDNLPPATPAEPDLAGKPDVASLAQAYRASSAEGQRLNSALQQKEAEVNTLKAQIAQGFTPRQDIPQRHQGPAERLYDAAVPVDALDEYINSKLQAAFTPIVQAAGARNQVLTRKPDYAKYEAEIANYITQDPERSRRYQQMFGADPVGAIEWSIDRFTETQKAQAPEPSPTRKAQAEAQVPSGRQAESRNTDGQFQEALAQARERAMKTGRREDIERWTQMRLRQGITPEFYNTGHPGKR